MDATQRKAIKKEFREIAGKRFEAVAEVELDNLDLNPYLLKLLGLRTPEEIADFMIAQRAERGAVTSYGTRIQNVAKAFAKGTGAEGADIMKEVDGTQYYIQMKAGPNTVNKGLMKEINDLLHGAVRRDPGSAGLMGMTYGKASRVSGIIQGYSEVDWKIGRDFWAFISGDPNCARALFDIATEVVEEVQNEYGGVPFPELLAKKRSKLAAGLRDRYGAGPGFWDRFFEDNV